MTNFSSFLNQQAWFGAYPTQKECDYLQTELGVSVFVNLTCSYERLVPYVAQPNTRIVYFPIQDMDIPRSHIEFSSLIVYLHQLLEDPQCKMYVHCRGGNGRSGIVVAALLALRLNVGATIALAMTKKYHSLRPSLKPKYLQAGSPQTPRQRNFILKLFSSYAINAYTTHPHKSLLLPSAAVSVTYKGSTYDTFNGALKQHPDEVLDITRCKIRQHPQLSTLLLSTGLKPIVYYSVNTMLGVSALTHVGMNLYGKALMDVRRELLLEKFEVR